MTEWELFYHEGKYIWSFTHWVNDSDLDTPERENKFKAHLLLEFLRDLKVLEYQYGYDGIYYDILIPVRK